MKERRVYFHRSNRGKEECVERRSKEGGLGGTGLGVGFVLDFFLSFLSSHSRYTENKKNYLSRSANFGVKLNVHVNICSGN